MRGVFYFTYLENPYSRNSKAFSTIFQQDCYLCAVARIISIDYGTKRVGLAVTDPLQIIATGLDTVPTANIFDYLAQYFQTEEVEKIVVGEPFNLDGTPSEVTPHIKGFITKLSKLYPTIPIDRQDERFTSVEARAAILQSGVKKKKRRDKTLVDKISAVIILQNYLNHTT